MTGTAQFKLRILEELRIKLEAAATVRGVSPNAEAVWRLDNSFLDQEKTYGHEATMSLLRTMAAVTRAVEDHKGAKWDEDTPTKDAVHMALYGLIGTDGPLLQRDDKHLRQHRKQIAIDLIHSALKFGGFDKKQISKVAKLIEVD